MTKTDTKKAHRYLSRNQLTEKDRREIADCIAGGSSDFTLLAIVNEIREQEEKLKEQFENADSLEEIHQIARQNREDLLKGAAWRRIKAAEQQEVPPFPFVQAKEYFQKIENGKIEAWKKQMEDPLFAMAWELEYENQAQEDWEASENFRNGRFWEDDEEDWDDPDEDDWGQACWNGRPMNPLPDPTVSTNAIQRISLFKRRAGFQLTKSFRC